VQTLLDSRKSDDSAFAGNYGNQTKIEIFGGGTGGSRDGLR
jgi:hypothetical protein